MTQSELPNRISYERLQSQLKLLEIKRNRLNNSIAKENRKNISTEKAARNERTRTLIQLGGLIKLSGLTDICDINDGDDLQNDLDHMDKAATLLGILITCVENFKNELNNEHLDHFKEKGIRTLKMSPYQSKQYRS